MIFAIALICKLATFSMPPGPYMAQGALPLAMRRHHLSAGSLPAKWLTVGLTQAQGK